MLSKHTVSNASSLVSINFSELWRKGKIPTKSVRVVELRDLALMYDLEDFLINIDIPLRVDRDVDLFLSTKSKKDIFHLAVTMVVRQHGISKRDRFFYDGDLVSTKELKTITISGRSVKSNRLDSLYDLLLLAYRRCLCLFKELNQIKNNKDYFYYLCKILNAVYDMILDQKNKDFVGYLHVKGLLTLLMQQRTGDFVRSYMEVLH